MFVLYYLSLFLGSSAFLIPPVKPVKPVKPSTNVFLEGLFAPVQERTFECKTIGTIPDVVSKTIFARVGPNPMFEPSYGYHLFDGDGMVHWVDFKNNTTIYRNQFVKTLKIKAEESFGKSLYPNTIGYFLKPFALIRLAYNYLLQICSVIPFIPKSDFSTANTNIVQHSSNTLALCEGGLPYSIKFKSSGMDTTGVYSCEGFITDSFTAHPKINPRDSRMYGIGSSGSDKICVYVFDKHGQPHHKFKVDFRYPVLMHDVAITSKHILLLDMPLMYRMELLCRSTIPVVFDESFTSRIGVIDMEDEDGSSLVWYTVPGTPYLMSHVVNSYVDSNKIHLITCDIANFSISDVMNSKSSIHEIVIDTESGEVTREPVLRDTEMSLDFPVINMSRTGFKNRYVYTTEFKNGVPGNILKVDLIERKIVDSVVLEPGEYSGDCAFVANGTKEDDGFLLSFVSTCISSKLCIWDTKNMDLVAMVEIPVRIPFGFHSTIINA